MDCWNLSRNHRLQHSIPKFQKPHSFPKPKYSVDRDFAHSFQFLFIQP